MKITIYKETKKPRTIKITNKLFINRIFANYIYKKRKKENKLISKKQIILILKIAKKILKNIRVGNY